MNYTKLGKLQMKIKVSPVEKFYKQIEINKRQAALNAGLDKKPKRGRPRKNKLYFTQDTEDAIIAYNNELDYDLRNKVFNEYIHKPLMKMCENLVHRYKFYHFDATTKEVQYEVIAFLLEKLPKYTLLDTLIHEIAHFIADKSKIRLANLGEEGIATFIGSEFAKVFLQNPQLITFIKNCSKK